MKKYDASTPRRMYWDSDIHCSTKCPECHGLLECESHSYMVLIKDRENVETFIAGNDAGKFCRNCPVVVLEKNQFHDLANLTNGSAFTVAGIVDLDSTPQNEEDVSLTEFLKPIPPEKPLRKKNKIARNGPCPCGSGKKFKKCCISLNNNTSMN